MSVSQESATARVDAHDCSYNLFCNKQRPELYCAVPEDRPIPHFLGPEQWMFECSLHPWDRPPPGFRSRVAYVGVRFNGYYLFQLIGTGHRTTASHISP